MKILQVLVTTCAVVGATSAFAGTITFDNGPTGVDLGGFYQGVTFGEGAQITSQELPSFPAHSGNFELTDTDIGNPSIAINLQMAATGVSFWYNSYLGFTLEAFSSGGTMLSSNKVANTVNPATFQGTTQEFSFGVSGIASILILDNGIQDVTIDDFTASTVSGNPVPEATNTVALLGIAGIGLAALRRKLAQR